MNAEFFEAIEAIEKEKGIPRGYMYDKIKQAMLAAFRKDNPECEDNVAIDLDEEKYRIEMYVTKTVVDQVEDPSHEINLEAIAFSGTYTKIAIIQRSLTWSLHKNDTQIREALIHIFRQ